MGNYVEGQLAWGQLSSGSIVQEAIFLGDNYLSGNNPGAIVRVVITRGQFTSGAIIQVAIIRGTIFLGDNYPQGQFSEGQLSGGQFSSGTIVLGGNCPGAIIRETIMQGAIVRGAIFLGDNCPRTVLRMPNLLELCSTEAIILQLLLDSCDAKVKLNNIIGQCKCGKC